MVYQFLVLHYENNDECFQNWEITETHSQLMLLVFSTQITYFFSVMQLNSGETSRKLIYQTNPVQTRMKKRLVNQLMALVSFNGKAIFKM
jgi:hypothetical protein